MVGQHAPRPSRLSAQESNADGFSWLLTRRHISSPLADLHNQLRAATCKRNIFTEVKRFRTTPPSKPLQFDATAEIFEQDQERFEYSLVTL